MDSTEKTAKEEVAGRLAASLEAFVTTQPQPPDLTTVNVSTVVSGAILSTGGQAEKKNTSFYPGPESLAKSALAIIGGTEDIVVVPDSFEMQQGNKAITLKGATQVGLYKKFVESEAGRDKWAHLGLDVPAMRDRIVEDTILIKESLASSDPLTLQGNVWHEHGHVLHGDGETGDVFAHELSMILRHRRGDAMTWTTVNRKLSYFDQYGVDPGRDKMLEELRKIIPGFNFESSADSQEVEREKKTYATVAAQEVVVAKGQSIEGTIADLRARMAPADGVITGAMTKGEQVTAGGCTWIVDAHFPDDAVPPDSTFDKFKVRRLT